MTIEVLSDIYENYQEDMAIKASKDANDSDAGNSISVVAVEA